MITLNTDKGLIKVENWEDIETSAGYVDNLDPSDKDLKEIVGRYIFPYKVNCGLSTCHTPHYKGYIVETKDGLRTNIGKDCGKTYFSVDFETMSKEFDRSITEKENRDKLYTFSFRLENVESQIYEIRKREFGADWAYKAITSFFSSNAECPSQVVKKLNDIVKSGNNKLYVDREATDQEIEFLEASNAAAIRKPHYIQEDIGQILGIEALYKENDLRDLLVLDLGEQIKSFKKQKIDELDYKELNDWAAWIGTVDQKLDRASIVLKVAKKFLAEDNLEQFSNVLESEEERKNYRKFVRKTLTT